MNKKTRIGEYLVRTSLAMGWYFTRLWLEPEGGSIRINLSSSTRSTENKEDARQNHREVVKEVSESEEAKRKRRQA